MYDVVVFPEMLMKKNLHLDLLWREAALLECMVLVDEFDGDDRFGGVVRDGFANAVQRSQRDGVIEERQHLRGIGALSNGLAHEPEW